jgi:hypothetical protein
MKSCINCIPKTITKNMTYSSTQNMTFIEIKCIIIEMNFACRLEYIYIYIYIKKASHKVVALGLKIY